MKNKRVLVLNNSYQPIQTMSVKKAMGKLSRPDSTLSVVEWSETNVINTVRGQYPVPSVLRLEYYIDIRKRRRTSGAKREKIYVRDRLRCQYCNLKYKHKHPKTGVIFDKDYMTLDHIVPQSRGGATSSDNLVLACKPCNQQKGDRTPEEAGMPLLTSLTLLKAQIDVLSMNAYADIAPEWKKYIFLESEGDSKYTHSA